MAPAVRQKRYCTWALCSTGAASQGQARGPPSRFRSNARGRSGPSHATQPVGGWAWMNWVAGPKNPSRPISRS